MLLLLRLRAAIKRPHQRVSLKYEAKQKKAGPKPIFTLYGSRGVGPFKLCRGPTVRHWMDTLLFLWPFLPPTFDVSGAACL